MEETRECDEKREEGIVSTSSRCGNAILKTVCFQGTENSIKNHWNCSVAKKVTVLSSDLYTRETKAESREPKEVNQIDDQKVNWKGSADNCSLDLVLGIAQGKDSDSKLPRKNDKTKLPRTIFDDGSAASLIHQGNFQKIIHETSEALSGTLQLSLRTPSDVPICNKTTSNFHQRPAFPDSGKRLSESFSEPQYNVFSGDYFENGNSKLSGQFKNSLSYGMTPEVHKENKVVGAAEDTIPGRLCYRPLQWKDLNILLKTDSFPDTDSYIQTISSPILFHTPPTQNKGVNVDCSSLDSILRSAARTFNTPSIIRKRRLQISEKIEYVNHDDYNSENGGSLSNEKQLVLPPLKSQKLETSAVKSIEKRLEPAFDAEWDSANIVSRTTVADDSFGANCGK
ncbi:uncharacterized protein LOC136061239 [Quercus suber]|uniref:uncharacterized protein LOC136061239 n=1 Tax=Quercus suber TaxID=58331 RepID=UPI0032DFA3D7